MIKVLVRNFQSIREASIEIDGFTVVTGSNNSGKSALMRAIRGAFQNTPGTTFVRHGSSKTEVSIDFGDQKVQWSKGTGKDRPTYILDEGSPIHPGQKVPDEVQDLGVHPIEAGGKSVWPQFAPQFTGQVFLLDEPGSVLAEAVADVERVGQLNRALKSAQSDQRSASSFLKVRRQDQERLQQELREFDGIDVVAAQIRGLAARQQKAEKIKRVLESVEMIRDRLHKVCRVIENLSGIESCQTPEDKASPLVQEIESLVHIRERYRAAKQRIQSFEGIGEICAVDCSRVKRAKEDLSSIDDIWNRYCSSQKVVSDLEQEMSEAEKARDDIQKEIQEHLGDLGVCPTCGQEISHG